MKEENSTSAQKVFSFTFDYINFGRFDAGVVLHHANYYHLLEELRERFLLSKGTSYKSLMDNGYHLPIVSAKQEFKKPIYYSEVITGELFIEAVSRSSITFLHHLKNQSDELVHTTSTKHVSVQTVENKFRTSILPVQLREIIGG